jgi:hypothetical protein
VGRLPGGKGLFRVHMSRLKGMSGYVNQEGSSSAVMSKVCPRTTRHMETYSFSSFNYSRVYHVDHALVPPNTLSKKAFYRNQAKAARKC